MSTARSVPSAVSLRMRLTPASAGILWVVCMTDSLSGCKLCFYHRLRAWRYAPGFFLPMVRKFTEGE